MQRRLNDDDVYIIHPEKKHIAHKVSSKNSGLRYGDKAQGHKNFASYVDHANKKHGAGHIAMTGRDINDQASYKHITEDVEMDQKYQAPFSFASDIAKDFAPKVLTEEKHDDGTPKSTGNAFDFKSFVAKKKEDSGENLRNHDKQKTTTGAVFKRKEDAKGADESDTKSAEKRGRGRPAGVYGSYKKRIKEAIEAHAMQIDELSKKTLGSYTKKAAEDVGDLSADRRSEFIHKGPTKKYNALLDKRSQRKDGIRKAVDRLTKESVDE